jgi:hypothetical protein
MFSAKRSQRLFLDRLGSALFQSGAVFREQLQFGLQPMIEVEAVVAARFKKI